LGTSGDGSTLSRPNETHREAKVGEWNRGIH